MREVLRQSMASMHELLTCDRNMLRGASVILIIFDGVFELSVTLKGRVEDGLGAQPQTLFIEDVTESHYQANKRRR
jgi:hypothetical protein